MEFGTTDVAYRRTHFERTVQSQTDQVVFMCGCVCVYVCVCGWVWVCVYVEHVWRGPSARAF